MNKSADQQILLISSEKSQIKSALKNLRNFLAGRAIGITRDELLLEEVLKILFCLYSLHPDKKNITYSDIKTKFSEIKSKYPEFYTKKDKIILDEESTTFSINKLIT